MTRSEQEMYRNIERIAVALETIVIQGKDQKLDQFKKATNLIYGNEPTTISEDKLQVEGRNYDLDNQGRSSDNYQYPDKQTNKSIRKDGLTGYQPNITNQLDDRIYQESQATTGGEFHAWYHALTPDERESYGRVYGN